MKHRLQGYVTTYPARFPYLYARDWMLEPADAGPEAEARPPMHQDIRSAARQQTNPNPRRSIAQRLLTLLGR